MPRSPMPPLRCRSPYGERGLKSQYEVVRANTDPSLSLRRAWIEIFVECHPISTRRSLSLRRAWIEIPRCRPGTWLRGSLSLRRAWIEIGSLAHFSALAVSRSPYGERGLKFDTGGHCVFRIKSLSLRRAWIEISKGAGKRVSEMSRSPYGERGLKCRTNRRGKSDLVALLTESVD